MNIEQLYQKIKDSAGVSTDTRSLKPEMVFFAIQGEKFDANNFIQQALDAGAALVVTQNPAFEKHPQCYFTNNTLKTLQEIALWKRKQMKAIVIGITGTNGKTTTKELMREALSAAGTVEATQGNLNNHIGVPLTLLSMNNDTDFAIVEMGANHPGEIEFLCNIACPDYGVITNIGRAHLEGFGSFEGVIKTKTELYSFIAKNNGSVFVNEDDPLLVKLSEGCKKILYGTKTLDASIVNDSNPFLRCHWKVNEEGFLTQTKLSGSYNLPNLLAAISIGLHFGANAKEINKKLSEYTPSNMRSQWIETEHNQLILDAYNANPSSMSAALKNFADLQTEKKLPILGDMLELGSYSDNEHHEVLNLIKELSFKSAVLIGPCFSKFRNEFPAFLFFSNTAEAKTALTKNTISGFTILLKGSRGIGVENLKEIL
ncbi:MAG TPA: UDP-N-acetylmuramoyl-tripeptide--D-alanyl-D-alanine ligase [Bacteroidales bacterium]|nr:UDP-N-acetylmuramoyl-tripeptide--D-alanyl-D-alanine ligase [Bacteroidales bacterium]